MTSKEKCSLVKPMPEILLLNLKLRVYVEEELIIHNIAEKF
jgi:hypothetical protein